MIQLGLFGDGPLLEEIFQPALLRLSERVRVASVHSPVLTRAEQIAKPFNATVDTGLRVLLRHPELDGMILLDTDWYGDMPLQFCLAQKRPALISIPLICRLLHQNVSKSSEPFLNRLIKWEKDAHNEGIMLMPACFDRYEPFFIRLQELIATGLGSPQSIELTAPFAEANLNSEELCLDSMIALWRMIDLSQTLMKQMATSVSYNASEKQFQIEFPNKSGSINTVSIQFESDRSSDIHNFICDNGNVKLTNENQVDGKKGPDAFSESLPSDRAGVDILVDLFCRRIAGGLLPCPDLSDAIKTATIITAIQEVYKSEGKVHFATAY